MSPPVPTEIREAAVFRFALRRFQATSDRVVRRFGLTPRQYLLLLAIEAAPGRPGRRSTVGDLVSMLALAHSTVTELLDRAEGEGLVARSAASDDRRVVEIRATPRGRERFAAAFEAMAPELESMVAAVGHLRRRLGEPR